MNEQVNPRERRLVLRLLDYWRRIADERDWPRPADVDGGAIADMWPFCFLIGLDGGPCYTFVGDYQRQMYGGDPTGLTLAAAQGDTLIGRASSYVQDVLARRVPITYGGQFVDHRGRGLLYRSILLPLSADGTTIGAILGGANCRELDSSVKP